MQNREMHKETTVATLAKAKAPALSGWKEEEEEEEEEEAWRRSRPPKRRRAASSATAAAAAGNMTTRTRALGFELGL